MPRWFLRRRFLGKPLSPKRSIRLARQLFYLIKEEARRTTVLPILNASAAERPRMRDSLRTWSSAINNASATRLYIFVDAAAPLDPFTAPTKIDAPHDLSTGYLPILVNRSSLSRAVPHISRVLDHCFAATYSLITRSKAAASERSHGNRKLR